MPVRLSHKPDDFIDQEKNQFQILEQIKCGGMGTVYKVLKIPTQSIYAVKECDILDDPRNRGVSRSEAVDIFLREASYMESIKCPMVPYSFLFSVKQNGLSVCLKCGNPVMNDYPTCQICKFSPESLYYKPQTIDIRLYLFMDYIEGYDLDEKTHMWAYPLKKQNIHEILRWMLEIGQAIELIHTNDLMYRDLKPQNIRYCTSDKKVYLLDFGLVRSDQPRQQFYVDKHKTAQLGTDGYAPPEQVEGKPCKQSDIYALTMTTIELLTNLHPTDSNDREDILKGHFVDYLSDVSPVTINMLNSALSLDPLKRPAAKNWVQIIKQELSLSKQAKTVSSLKQAKIIQQVPINIKNQKQTKNQLYDNKILIAITFSLLTAVVVYYIYSTMSSKLIFHAIARSDTVIYSYPDRSKIIKRLKGGEKLIIQDIGLDDDDYVLKIISIDGRSYHGYLLRSKVEIY